MYFTDGSDLIERSGRLIALTNTLNLEDLDEKCILFVWRNLDHLLHPCVQDFWCLQSCLYERQRLACTYGVDSPTTSDDQSLLFAKMRVMSCQLFKHGTATDVAIQYCTLKSQLCLKENDFFDEVFTKVDYRVKSCATEEQAQRLRWAVLQLRNTYQVYLC